MVRISQLGKKKTKQPNSKKAAVAGAKESNKKNMVREIQECSRVSVSGQIFCFGETIFR